MEVTYKPKGLKSNPYAPGGELRIEGAGISRAFLNTAMQAYENGCRDYAAALKAEGHYRRRLVTPLEVLPDGKFRMEEGTQVFIPDDEEAEKCT